MVNGEWSVERLFALFAIRHSLFTNHYSLVGLHLDVGRLDDRPPFVHLGLVEGGERFRRQLLARRDGLPQIRNALAHARIREGGDNGIIQLGDEVSRGSLGRPQPMPERDVHARYSDRLDRKSTRLNSSHLGISYAVFCLKNKNIAQ